MPFLLNWALSAKTTRISNTLAQVVSFSEVREIENNSYALAGDVGTFGEVYSALNVHYPTAGRCAIKVINPSCCAKKVLREAEVLFLLRYVSF